MLHRYETLLLTVPEITQDETKNLESSVDKLVKEAKGIMLSFERWGKFKLTYPIKKNDYGVYFLARFEVDQGTTVVNDIKSLFVVKLNNLVMRDMITRLDLEDSLAYQRPQSLEETQMEGLLSSVDKASKKAPVEVEKPVAKEATEDKTVSE